ncbi:MAG: hypothetical protein ACRELB_03330, partial [Polyangiaceae bacterium]
VRQRVSRMRRWLRKRWLREALLVASAGLLAGAFLLYAPRGGTVPIVADPAGDSAGSASAALQGSWHVVRVAPDASLDPARRALLDAEALGAVVQVDGARIALASATRHTVRRLEVGAVVDGRFDVRVIDGSGPAQAATASFDPDGRLVLVSEEGPWRGTVVLAR